MSISTKVKKVIIISFSVLVSIAVTAFILLAVMMSGGLKGAISGLKPAPNPNSQSIALKRQVSQQSIENAFKEIETSTGLTAAGSSAHEVCYSGQHNWKIQDEYAHRCEYRMTKYYGLNGDFRQYILDFDSKVQIASWSPTDGDLTMREMLETYYDTYYGPDKPPTLAFGNKYLVSSLPTPGYHSGTKRMELEFAEKKTTDLTSFEYFQTASGSIPDIYDKKNFQDTSTLFTTLSENNQFIIGIAIQEQFFQN